MSRERWAGGAGPPGGARAAALARLGGAGAISRNRRIWVLFKSYLKPFGIGAVYLVVTNILALRIPRELGRAIQLLKDASDGTRTLASVYAAVPSIALIIIALAIGVGITRVLSRTSIFNVGRLIEYDLRNDLFTHLTRLSPRYYQSIATGDLTSRVVNDTTFIRLLFGLGFLHGVNTIVAVLLASTQMAALDWRLTLYCLIPFPIVFLVIWRLARALHIFTRRVQEKLADLTSQVQEDLSGIAVVKSYAIEDVEAARFERQSDQFVVENMKLAKVRALLFPLMLSIGGFGSLVVLWFGGRAVIVDQTIQVGQFIEFSGYIGHLTWPLMALGWVLSVWQRGTAALDRIVEILDTPPDIVAPEADTVDTDVGRGAIELRGVTFRYEADGDAILEGVNLTLEPGRRIGIVGRSGSGKTTLISLIVRLYDVDEGEVLIDGVPIQQIPLERLRGAIGYAPQEPFLFSTTLEKNIRLGVDAERHRDGVGASANGELGERVARVIETVRFGTDLHTLPDGLETMVGERGITLSGGQKQRVALARALLRRPRILILDDSLSSVDTRTERAILDHLEEALAGRTAIVVTHRFSVLELLDEIVVLDNGRLVERGSHGDLMARPDGVYAGMVQRQKRREELSTL